MKSRAYIRSLLSTLLLLLVSVCTYAMPLDSASIDQADKASLQRGARWYMNYCIGCHSLQYLRYNRMAKDLGIVDNKGQVAEVLLKSDIIFNDAKPTAAVKNSLSTVDAQHWFGVKPPDLSLMAKIKGPNWIYTYLRSFYRDPSRPLGTNNVLAPNVAMPNVLWLLQGIQIPVYQQSKPDLKTVDHLVLIQRGVLAPEQFNQAMNDIVNFLIYTSDPKHRQREQLGYWVICYLIIFLLFVYLLYREIVLKRRL